ncbi:MAG: class I SAM-dependent DNA methyltransferase, partial [Candidatus Omnitrophota bacterium]
LVSVLKQLHDDLDAAVFEAYGWSDLATSETGSRGRSPSSSITDGLAGTGGRASSRAAVDAQILTRLVTLNAARAAEESAGQIRWLRPEYQAAGPTVQQFDGLAVQSSGTPTVKPSDRPTVRPLPWPSSLPEQVRVLRGALESAAAPVTADTLTARFKRAQTDRIAELLETLVIVGQARKLPDGRYTGKV